MTFLYSRLDKIDLISDHFKKRKSDFLKRMNLLCDNIEFIIVDSNDEREELEVDYANFMISPKMFFRKLFKIGNCFQIIILDTDDDSRMLYETILIDYTYKELLNFIIKISKKFRNKYTINGSLFLT